MTPCEGLEVLLHSYLTSAVRVDDMSSRPRSFSPREGILADGWIGNKEGPIAAQDVCEKGHVYCLYQESNTNFLVV